MPEIVISAETTPDPNATPKANISGDANKVVVDPNKPAGDKSEEKLILGKYKTQADLEAAHVALEKKLGEKTVTPEQAREAVEKAGLDIAAITQEYATNKGVLSDKTIKALEAKGITPETVNTYVNGLKAQSTQMRQEFAQLAGSEEALKSVLEWAATSGDPTAVKAYNDAIDSGNVTVAKLALQVLGNSYNEAVGTDPALLNGDASADSGVQPYTSPSQVTAAMRDSRYADDPEYRKTVERRLERSNVFNVRTSNR